MKKDKSAMKAGGGPIIPRAGGGVIIPRAGGGVIILRAGGGSIVPRSGQRYVAGGWHPDIPDFAIKVWIRLSSSNRCKRQEHS